MKFRENFNKKNRGTPSFFMDFHLISENGMA